jgi:type II secretory pathway component GspD/PulD (secretin)
VGQVALAVTAWLLLFQPSFGQTNSNHWQQPGPLDSYQWGADSKPAESEPGFRVYPLQQLDALTAQRQLAALLGEAPDVEIVVDAERNRLLIRGNAQVQQLAADLMTKLDRPAASASPASPPSEPNTKSQLEAYALTPATRDVLLVWQRYADQRNDLRVAIDERTSQALVLAPPALHTQLRTELTQARPPLPLAGTGQQPQPQIAPSPRPSAPNTLQLRNLRADDLRQRLERLVSRPLAASWDTSGQWQTFALEQAPGAAITVSVERDSGAVQLNGEPQAVVAWRSVIEALDSPPTEPGSVTQLVSTKPASQDRVRQALKVLQSQENKAPADRTNQVSMLMQPRDADSESASSPLTFDDANLVAQAQPPAARGSNQPAQPNAQVAQSAIDLAQAGGDLLGPVQIEFIEGLDVIVLRGSERDVQRVMEIINQIEQLSAVTVPAVEVYPLKYVDSEALGALLSRLYQQVLGPRIGAVSITPLGKPNALLLVGRAENVRMAIELVQKLDQPVPATTRFEVFPLKNGSASEAKTMIDSFLAREDQDEGADAVPTLAPRALVVADVRTNSLVVSAGPRDLAEIAALVARIDAPSGAAIDQVRVFPLKNAVATDLAEVLRNAIQTQSATGQREGDAAAAQRASALEFTTIGLLAQETFKAGVLTGARVTADARANALVVTAPSDSMNLIAALVEQLDQAPDVVAELKVFTIANGDAVSLTEMLRALFAAPEGQQNAGAGGVGEGGLVRIQFSYDERTNSIIAAGSREDLAVVEAILLRLDQGDIRERETTVYRLKNAFAQNVADALNNWLTTRRAAEAEAEVTISPFEQIEREVIIVPELASNSLLVSATPRYYRQVRELIDQLDERPPMVMIQVLIAEVRLNDTDEFGVELGLQDSLLFDRSLLGDLSTITTTTENQSPGGAVTTTTQQTIVNAPGQPGFNFNNQTLGNNLSTNALATAASVASQGLSNFSLGRVNNELGFGGFVLSASSNSVSVLLRALQEKRRLEVLSRPQIMALDGQEGIIQVGQQVPRITATSLTQFGQTNSIIYEPVGIILHVVPRISPDGLVVMQIEAVKSEVGSEAEGIPISVSASGEILRAPRIDNTQAITTVSALTGQTVVLSGLLTTRKFDIHRSVPLISQIPLIGDLFRYDSVQEERKELLIILTPRIIYNKLDAEIVKQVESSRMSWILSDVIALNGESGLRSRCDEWGDDCETEAVYPNYVPEDDTFVPYPEIRKLPASGPSLEQPSSQPTEALPSPTSDRRPSPSSGPLRQTSYTEPVRLPQVSNSR